MTDAEKVILSARQLAGEYNAEGTTAYDCFLIGALETEIKHLCRDNKRLRKILEEKINE